MSGAPGRPIPPRHYVNRLELLEMEAARRLAFEEALEAAKIPEATPRPCIAHFEASWPCVRPAGSGHAPGCCALEGLRAAAVLRARFAVQSARA